MRKINIIAKTFAVLVLLIFIGIAGCKKAEPGAFVEQKTPVRVESAVRGDISETVSLTGDIQGINTIEIFPKISGRIEQLFVDKGAKVKSGDKLAIIEHSSITEQVKQFEATLESTKLQLKQLEINMSGLEKDRERILALAEAGAVSEQRKDEIETRYKTTKEQQNQLLAQIKQTEAMLEQAKIQENEATLVSPISGIVSERFEEAGDMASPLKPAFAIVQMNEVKIIAHLAEQFMPKLSDNMPADIKTDAYPEDSFSGKVSRIAPTLDPRTRSVEIEIKIDNADLKLKPGMSARIDLTVATHKNVFIAPWDYVIGEAGDKYFLLLAKDGKVKKQPVTLGIQSRGLVEIIEGLTEKDLIITTLGAYASDGMEIEIVE